jgi:hypothetical protein
MANPILWAISGCNFYCRPNLSRKTKGRQNPADDKNHRYNCRSEPKDTQIA